MCEEPNGQDTIPTTLNGKNPNESAIFALHACIKRTRDEGRNNKKSESSRLCCATRYPEKPVCYGNKTNNWNWVNRGCSNQYPYSSNYQSYVRDCPVQYYCPTCQTKEKEVVKENCCNKQIETIVTWPCCYCSQLTSESCTKKAPDKKKDCRNVETQCKCCNEEIIHRSFDGTGDSQSTKHDAVVESSSETDLMNEVSKETDQKKSRIKESGEGQPILSKTSVRDKKKLDSKQSKSITDVSKKSDKKAGKSTSQSRSQAKLDEDSAPTNYRFNEKSKDKYPTQNLGTKKTDESVKNAGKSKTLKSVSNIDEYVGTTSKKSTRSTANDKKMKSMIPTPNGRRNVESKGVEPREKSSARINSTDVDVKKSYVLSSSSAKSSRKDNINKNESMNGRRSNGVRGAEKIEKPSRKDLDKLDINKSYVLNSKNNKIGKIESNVKKETMGISKDKSEIKKKQLKNDKIDKVKKVQSFQSYRDSKVEVDNIEEDQTAKKRKPSKCHDSIDVDINKSYVLYSNDNNEATSSSNLKPYGPNCNCCCCCKLCCNADGNNTIKAQETSRASNLSYSSSGEAKSFEDSDNSSCSCTTCSCSDMSEDENKQQQSQILNQKQKQKIGQNDNVEIAKKQACKRKVEFSSMDQINKIFTEKENQQLYPSFVINNDENTLPDLTRNASRSEKNKKSALQSLSKQAAECPTCPCCGVKLDGILEFSSKKTKQSSVSRECNVGNNNRGDIFAVKNGTQPCVQKVGNYNNVSTELRPCDCDNQGFNKSINGTKGNRSVNNNYKNERTKDININRKKLSVSTQNDLDNTVDNLNCLCNEKVSMDKPCTCPSPNIMEYAPNQNQRCDNNDISTSCTSDSISYSTNSEQVEKCRPVCEKRIPCVNNIENKCNNNNSKSRSGSIQDEIKIVCTNRNTTISRSTEVDVGPDTIQQARQRSMNTYVCAEDIETTHRIYC